MADYYLQFSETLDGLSLAEREWLARQLETIYVAAGREYTCDELPETCSPEDIAWCGLRVFRELAASDEDDDGEAGFQFALNTDPATGCYLWLYAEEDGRPDHVAYLVQRFLQVFRPRDCWSLTYAVTCSKPRPGAFGGGALFVTADAIEPLHAHAFIEARRAAFDALHQLSPTERKIHDYAA